MTGLTAHVVVASRGVDASLGVALGETLALLGPNGSGKTTVIEALAGILRPDAGLVMLDGVVFDDPGQRRHLPAAQRGVGLVSQSSDLFPSMTARENVEFGLRARGVTRREARSSAHEWLERVGVADSVARHPAQLSGGQARRVALARALATSPHLLLLDEPFAGLDVEAASAMRALIKDLLGDVTTVLSTHDALDAYALASHVAILGKGQVVQSGPTHDVLSRPLTPFAARVASRVLITGTLSTPTTLEVDGGGTLRVSQRGRGSATLPRGARAAIAVGPRDIALGTGLDSDGIRDTVVALEPQGDTVRVHGSRFAVDVEPAAAAALRPGDPITLRLPERAMPYALGD